MAKNIYRYTPAELGVPVTLGPDVGAPLASLENWGESA